VKAAVISFPGSNCDQDAIKAIVSTMQIEADLVWHAHTDLSSYDLILVPGGFSYGDYLRSGAIARFSPVMEAVANEAERGKFVIGICNGFQILTEAGLLPGALRRNESLQFQCEMAHLVVENTSTPFTADYHFHEEIIIPIAHGEGNYYADEATLDELVQNDQIVFRYTDGHNPNGSVDSIAGIVNKKGNVLGMMPHPERAVHTLLGSEDGSRLFTSMLRTWGEMHGVR
jgi:phosphoribosylformylglycinamidine synthase